MRSWILYTSTLVRIHIRCYKSGDSCQVLQIMYALPRHAMKLKACRLRSLSIYIVPSFKSTSCLLVHVQVIFFFWITWLAWSYTISTHHATTVFTQYVLSAFHHPKFCISAVLMCAFEVLCPDLMHPWCILLFVHHFLSVLVPKRITKPLVAWSFLCDDL